MFPDPYLESVPPEIMNTDELTSVSKMRFHRLFAEQILQERAKFVEAVMDYEEGCADGKQRFLRSIGLATQLHRAEFTVEVFYNPDVIDPRDIRGSIVDLNIDGMQNLLCHLNTDDVFEEG